MTCFCPLRDINKCFFQGVKKLWKISRLLWSHFIQSLSEKRIKTEIKTKNICKKLHIKFKHKMNNPQWKREKQLSFLYFKHKPIEYVSSIYNWQEIALKRKHFLWEFLKYLHSFAFIYMFVFRKLIRRKYFFAVGLIRLSFPHACNNSMHLTHFTEIYCSNMKEM